MILLAAAEDGDEEGGIEAADCGRGLDCEGDGVVDATVVGDNGASNTDAAAIVGEREREKMEDSTKESSSVSKPSSGVRCCCDCCCSCCCCCC